ncbi:MAG TPA: signal peptidase I, partial [Gammaproteobacteria bacterium]|nr:signal peptidase I [Gammaproteobacteria bacterium]
MRRLFKFLLNVSIYIAIVVALLYGLPRFLSWYLETSYPIAAITSGSMWPALRQGDLVFIQHVSREDLKVGDIVVWQNPNGFTIHRVKELRENGLVTRGDANFTDDPPVQYEDVIGR